MSSKIRKALERAIELVETDVIKVGPNDRAELLEWLSSAHEALADEAEPE